MILMVEVKTLIDAKRLEYTGLFRISEIYDLIRNFFGPRGYLWFELRNREEVMPDGKHIWMTIQPSRTVNDYLRTIVRLEIVMKGVKEKDIVVDGHKQKYQQGHIKIEFSAIMNYDYRNKWEGNGFLFMMRTISDKFIRRDAMHESEDMCVRDCLQIEEEIRSYLNMSRFTLVSETHKMAPDKPA